MSSLHDLSTSTWVYGIVPADERWHAMKKVWDACEAAHVPVPQAVVQFFNDEEPDEAGVLLDLTDHASVRFWSPGGDSMREGFEVDLDALPREVRIVRVVNSY